MFGGPAGDCGGVRADDHGGSLAAARAGFPDAPEPRLDLSTGINPTPYQVVGARLDRLPEPADLLALEQVAARAYRAPAGTSVVAGPGSGILMTLIALLRGGAVAIVGPTYAGHARVWSAAGARLHAVATMEAAWESGAATVVLTRPNNPDGRVLAVGGVPDGRMLVIDEAFADLEPCAHETAARANEPGVILLRSFGKTYGLPGVRLAFALGADPLLARVRAALGPWPVSAPAIAAGLAALPDEAWRAGQRDRLGKAAGRLDAILEAAGLRIVGGTRLFRLASHPDAASVWARLGRAGILVRRFAEAPDRLRFGMPGEQADFARLAAALEKHGHRP